MKKRLIASLALAALLLCAILTACTGCTGGKNESGTTANEGKQTAEEPTGTEAATGDGWTKSY